MEYNKQYLLEIFDQHKVNGGNEENINGLSMFKAFENQSMYLGSIGNKSLYGICGLTSSCTRELYKMFFALQLCVQQAFEYDEEKLFDVEEVE